MNRSNFILLLFTILLKFTPVNFAQWTDVTNNLPSWGIGWALDAVDTNTALISITFGIPQSYVYLTTDAGASWIQKHWAEINPFEGATSISLLDQNHFWVATDYGRILYTENSGLGCSVL